MNLIDVSLFKYDGHKQHQSRFDYDGNNRIIYAGIASLGVASSDSGWQVIKYSYDGSGNVNLIQCASLNQIWDNRVGLVYS